MEAMWFALTQPQKQYRTPSMRLMGPVSHQPRGIEGRSHCHTLKLPLLWFFCKTEKHMNLILNPDSSISKCRTLGKLTTSSVAIQMQVITFATNRTNPCLSTWSS